MTSTTTPQTRDMLAEITPLIEFVPFYGPPAIFLLGPWLLLVLVLAGPFAVLLTLVAGMIVVAAALAAIVSILAAPYLLVRRILRSRARSVPLPSPAAHAVAIGSPRVAA
jgi:hypothetical protein